MKESLTGPSNPSGENGFEALNNWDLTDIATAPGVSPENRQRAEAEIARRKQAGLYSLETEPTEAYSTKTAEHLGSVTLEQAEQMTQSEQATQAEVAPEPTREFSRSTGKMTMLAYDNDAAKPQRVQPNQKIDYEDYSTYEDAPTHEKMRPPARPGDALAKPIDAQSLAREQRERSIDIDIDSQRKAKNRTKYAKTLYTRSEIADYETRANLRPSKENLPQYEHLTQSAEAQAEYTPDSAERRAEKLYNFYADNFDKNKSKWLSYGIARILERGATDLPTDTIMANGFWAREEGRIHEKIDPENTLSDAALNAELGLKARIGRELIPEGLDATSAKISAVEEKLNSPSKEVRANARAKLDQEKVDFRDAVIDGLAYAISTGARKDPRANDRIIYSVPVEKGAEIRNFMEKFGIGSKNDEDNIFLRSASFQGFVNIIEAIKYNKKETEKGFQTLDWYFDNFKYKEHMEAFLENMDAYQEVADNAWLAKYEEYTKRRREIDRYIDEKEQDTAPQLEDIEEMSEEELFADYDRIIGVANAEAKELTLFPNIEQFPTSGKGRSKAGRRNLPPTSRQKYSKFVLEYNRIKADDPSLNAYKCKFIDKNNRRKAYRVVRYGYRNSNIAIVCPIENASSDAAYVWIGQTGDNREGWQEAFVYEEDSDASISKYRTRQRDDVKPFYHVAAETTKGLNAVDNMWSNIYKYIEEEAI